MEFRPGRLAGVHVIHLDRKDDARGWFARVFEREAFQRLGLLDRFEHHNLVWNRTAGTLRGLHYQLPPHQEVKVVHPVTGSIFDAVVDLRPSSPTFGQWEGFTLRAAEGTLLYVPVGFAHGYQVLEDGSLVYYLMGDRYAPELERGIRWDDPTLAIAWPIEDPVVSDKDGRLPFWAP